MGCDIHTLAEVSTDGKSWRPNRSKVFKGWNGEPCQHPDDNRDYDWFAILADVRNGRGFAGTKTGEGFLVIAEPRGVPENASEQWKKEVERWDVDMHSHSWLEPKDFDSFDWNQVSIKNGVIPIIEYATLRGTGKAPADWCGAIIGAKIITLSQIEADKEIDKPSDKYSGMEIHVNYVWQVKYSEWFDKKLKTVVEPLRLLEKKFGHARMVFGFDN